mgnify:CR=1 FL=1
MINTELTNDTTAEEISDSLFPQYIVGGKFDGEKFDEDTKEASKFICEVLRHRPSLIKAHVDEHGWVSTEELLDGLRCKGFYEIGMAELIKIVERDKKHRYSFGGEDKSLIRANYGHSIPIDPDYDPVEPPLILYHGSCTKYYNSIQEKGLIPKERIYVHLTDDISTAIEVGDRHSGGYTDIYYIKAKEMYRDGLLFYTANGTWLTKSVPTKYFFDYRVINSKVYAIRIPRYVGNKKYEGGTLVGTIDDNYNLTACK